MRRGSISSELLMCGRGVRIILSLSLVARDKRCMYMAHVCFYVCFKTVWICGNVCCVVSVVEDSVFIAMEC